MLSLDDVELRIADFTKKVFNTFVKLLTNMIDDGPKGVRFP